MEGKGGKAGKDQGMSAPRPEGHFRRKRKGPGTEMGEELYCEILGKSINLWVPRFICKTTRSFGLFYALVELKE